MHRRRQALTAAKASSNCRASSLRSMAKTSVSPATAGSRSQPCTTGAMGAVSFQMRPRLVERPKARLPSRMMGRRVPDELAEAPPGLAQHLAQQRPAEGEHLHHQAPVSPGSRRFSSKPGRHADHEETP